MTEIAIRPIGMGDHSWVRSLLQERWGSTRVVTRGVLHQADSLPGFVAETHGRRQGLITFHINGGACEIVTLDSLEERQGIASALIEIVREQAARAGCTRLWAITTNDNHRAIHFYERQGFVLSAVHKDALKESRKLKPEIPFIGIDGTPLRDEIEFEQALAFGSA